MDPEAELYALYDCSPKDSTLEMRFSKSSEHNGHSVDERESLSQATAMFVHWVNEQLNNMNFPPP